MMKWLFTILILSSVICGIGQGRMDEVTNAALSSSTQAIQLLLKLAGGMCFWSGLMKIAEEAGLTEFLGKLLHPLTGLVFREFSKESRAIRLISMNITANLLGLGNAATPLGIAAMKELHSCNENHQIATNSMILLVVLNTASIQLIPTTVAMLRLEHGSSAPMEILPAVLISSLLSVCIGLLMCKAISSLSVQKGGTLHAKADN